jgi:CubicO group peptidase (beta-lactamase class C family)
MMAGVNVDIAKTTLLDSLGQYFWGGATGSAFWIDPKEELAVVFMTQVIFREARETLRRKRAVCCSVIRPRRSLTTSALHNSNHHGAGTSARSSCMLPHVWAANR